MRVAVEELRKKIDAVDDEILALLQKRLALARQVGKEKGEKGRPVFVPSRESTVLNRLLAEKKSLPADSARAVFSEIISMCRSAEKPLLVSYLGPPTTFTHMAALKRFGSAAQLVPQGGIADVFNSVEKGGADYGVVPIENSIEGTVNHTLDMFIDSGLQIVGEITVDVRHCLLSKQGIKRIKTVYSHPQALAQCRRWLAENLPNAELVEASSTARAAEFAAKRKGSAAIASELAASQFGLKVVAKDMEGIGRNVTRFLVVGSAENQRTGKDKTSIMFSVKHEAGALFKALQPFDKHKVNMTKIESRPARAKLWAVVFFVDFEGFEGDENVKAALGELREHCLFVKVLGSYPEEVSVSE
ncbi:MAG: prephenate dehydratase [Candidatus Diapherotrites archaeon]|nr:prephenate dehydratase [Candidatus Diapherotrites archaeon]